MNLRPLIVAALAGIAAQAGTPAAQAPPAVETPAREWAAWVEPGSPFFSSVLDGQNAGPAFPKINLTPRALVMNLGNDLWAAFDVDLLRVAAVWRGDGVTAKALAPGSYHTPDKKTPGGQFPAPEPDGTVWLATGIYPGWQRGDRPSLTDPREPAPSPEEVGRGPLPETMGRFDAIRLTRGGAVLEYTVEGVGVREWIVGSPQPSPPIVERHIQIDPSAEPLVLVLGALSNDAAVGIAANDAAGATLENVRAGSGEVHAVRVNAHAKPLAFTVAVGPGSKIRAVTPRAIPADRPTARWPQDVTTAVRRSRANDAFVVDEIALPLENPWRRDVRVSDIQFLTDGAAALVTLDGDVWIARGMHGDTVRWRRFATGLHEPLTLAIRDDEIFVFERNGIWRLRDTDGNGEADVHELFSNTFAQTADMREFPNTIRLAPRGEFVIAKGNQEATTLGKHNGRVLRVSADGRHATVLGWGFRQPNIGVNIRTGLVTASDQQGNYIPSTPLHIVRDGQFYGFLSALQPREVYPAPIAEPLTWIPHTVNASAISQVWLFDAKMGPLNDSMVHIGFNRPELFRVLFDTRAKKPQASVVSITRDFDFPPLNGGVNPADGQLYLAGFQILGWGTTARSLAGVARVRFTGAESTLPREVTPTDKGVLLRFDAALHDAAALDADNFSIESWQYQRTYKYGSPQLKADGTPGTDWRAPSRTYLSTDKRSVFVAVPGMKPVMQMRVGWSLKTAAGRAFSENAYFTPYELSAFDPVKEGFGNITVDLSPRKPTKAETAPISAEEGRRLFEASGCLACHSDAANVAKYGPTMKALYGKQRVFPRAGRVIADEAYLRESVLEPSAKIVPGFEKAEAGMPSYAGVLTPRQIESIILYIKSLQ